MNPTVATAPLDQVKAAWAALDAGAFASPSVQWRTHRPTIAVLSTHGGSGASTIALAIAEALGGAHLLELAPPDTSGLIAATTAELGEVTSGWWRGQRGEVLVEYLARWPLTGVIPAPARSGLPLVVDVADLAHHRLQTPAVQALLSSARLVVLTASATVPGLRRLAATAQQLPPEVPMACAVTGPPRRKWAPAVTAASASALPAGADRLVIVPTDPGLAVTGLTPAALPKPVRMAATHLLRLIPGQQALSERTL